MANSNFCAWNKSEEYGYLDISLGNCKLVGNTSADAAGANTTMAFNTGKWYSEYYLLSTGQSSFPYLSLSSGHNAEDPGSNTGYRGEVRFHAPNSTGMDDNTGSTGMTDNWGTVTLTETGVTAATNGDIIGFALDLDNKKLFISKNGTYYNSGNPATGTNPQATWTTNPERVFINGFCYTSGRGWIGNWGQDSSFSGNKSTGTAAAADGNGFGDFYYSPPSGFLAMCSGNQPISDSIDPAQTDDDHPVKLFNIVTYTGTGSTQSITGLGFQPDLVWIKERDSSTTSNHKLMDSSRGVHKALESNGSGAEGNDTNGLTAYGTDGFTVGSDGNFNESTRTYVAWCWRVNGGTTSTNTSGTIASNVQVNDTTGLSMVLYTGDGTQGATVGHGMSSAPDMVWTKNRSNGTISGLAMDWVVQLSSATGSPFDVGGRFDVKESLNLNNNGAFQAFHGDGSTNYGGYQPTSSIIPIPNNGNAPYWFNASTNNYLAYCWKQVKGFSKFGVYEGNNNANGPTVYCGFRPRLIFVKKYDGTGGWWAFDTARDTGNPIDKYLGWHEASTEGTNSNFDFLSTGFKLRNNDGDFNSSSKFIFGAWGDVPFKYANNL